MKKVLLSFFLIMIFVLPRKANSQILWDKEQIIEEYGNNYTLKGKENNVLVYETLENTKEGDLLKCETAFSIFQVSKLTILVLCGLNLI